MPARPALGVNTTIAAADANIDLLAAVARKLRRDDGAKHSGLQRRRATQILAWR